RSFGAALVALALGVLHVCAWAAGPDLHLVPDLAAFALAALASVAVAAVALAEGEEPLWCIAFAGAALAPFVTTEPPGDLVRLAAYGAVVGIVGAVGIGRRPWTRGARTIGGMLLVYALALALPSPRASWGALLAVTLPLAVAVGGFFPATATGFVRSRLRTAGIIAALAAPWAGLSAAPLSPLRLSVLLGAGGVLWLALGDRTALAPIAQPGAAWDDELGGAWVDGFLAPLLFAAGALLAFANSPAPWAPALVLAAAALLLGLALARREAVPERDALAFAAAVAALAANALAPWSWEVARPATAAGLGLVFAAGLLWRPSYSWLVAAVIAFVAAAAQAWILLYERAPYVYRPFATRPSLGALAVLAAGAAVAWRADAMAGALRAAVPRNAARALRDAPVVRRWAVAVPWVWAFLWAHRELAGAWSYAVATLALVSLETGVAVGLVGVGRARDWRRLRQAGLLLAVIAAVRALVAVDGVRSVSLRIASYLVASVFLLGIAYWYRRPGPEPVPGALGAAGPGQS
ncbi:MAG: hypothetical protein KGJ70_06095, partial [Gemmatimonadota bacterium]|nr:hypothetical protein [Gemmatimonadota bacterium]